MVDPMVDILGLIKSPEGHVEPAAAGIAFHELHGRPRLLAATLNLQHGD